MVFDHKEIIIKFLVVLLVCMKYDELVAAETRCIERERQALLKIKQELTDEYGFLSSWGSEECCNWKGVVCSNSTGHVTGLQFFRIGGKISPALLELHHLNYLQLWWNDFGGDRIPDFIGSIKMLEHLDLVDSNFSGIIPPQLGNLTNLRTLILNGNNLWSDSLYWLSDLSSLTRLEMSYSNISDTNWLQHVVLNLPALQILDMGGCMLGDVIASSADLFVNSSSSSLVSIDLSYNQLTSFDWLFNISYSLVSIDLSSNKLDGQIPDAFGNLSLEYLDLSDNKFTGPLPDLRACSGLRGLDVSSNRLTGPLLTSLGLPPMLEKLFISNNSLQGIITEANFVELQNLKRLDLSYNSLTLDLRADWIPPFQLEMINLRGCKMGRGSFPTWLQTQTILSDIDISVAGISGEVPRWVWNMSDLGYLNLSHNQNMPLPDLRACSGLRMLDVSSNRLTGPLLPSLGLPPMLEALDISNNSLQGIITEANFVEL